MCDDRSRLENQVYALIEPYALVRKSCEQIVSSLVDALLRAGYHLRNDPSLDEMKQLLVSVFHSSRPALPPILRGPQLALASASGDSMPRSEPISTPPLILPDNSETPGSQMVGRPMEILLVEDSRTFATITMRGLKKGGVQHRLTWLWDGQEALDFVQRNGRFARAPRPDLILLDLGLPEIDGRDVLAQIKSDESLKSIPVVVMTASTDEDDLAFCERWNVESYITKPINLSKFLTLVRKLKHYWLEDVILPAGV